MADFDPSAWDALALRDKEPAKAHAAFLDYVRMGAGRSLRKLHESYRQQIDSGSTAEIPPTTRLRTLMEWSTKYAWQDRIKAYKAERDVLDQDYWEKRQAQVREEGWAAGDKLLALAGQVLEQTPQFLDTKRRVVRGKKGEPDREVITVGIDAKAMLEAFKLAIELRRQAAEVKPPAQRIEHSGTVVEMSSAETESDLAKIVDEIERWKREQFGSSADSGDSNSNGAPAGA